MKTYKTPALITEQNISAIVPLLALAPPIAAVGSAVGAGAAAVGSAAGPALLAGVSAGAIAGTTRAVTRAFGDEMALGKSSSLTEVLS